jgi:isoamylase
MQTEKGFIFPYGANVFPGGVNFSLYAKEADSIALCLFRENDPAAPFEKIELIRTEDIWHIFVKDLPVPFAYAYEVKRKGEMHLVLDPYAKSVLSDPKWHDDARKEYTYRPLGKVIQDTFDWEGDNFLRIPKKDLIIYEMHVRGFTCHSSSKVPQPGTFKGIIDKIPYFRELGVNALELMPIQEFCEEDVIQINPENQKKLHNYFGYSTVNFFSLMNRYSSESEGNKASVEFKTLVKELHKNGIEVILDIVFNHTQEGNEKGPVLSFKALDPVAYYMINGQGQYFNYSGCGNTFNCNHPITMELIIQALRYWVLEYHIDGFRFDLAAVFSRGSDGSVLDKAPLLEFISFDPVLSSIKLIAEPWDAGGLYQVGRFASKGSRWSDWNGKYQQNVRSFIKGDHNQKGPFAKAISGSIDVFPNSPFSSINYVVAHDGFTLADLVSYNEKHNLGNGDDNNDGMNQNDSWNCGFEGTTTKKQVLNLRMRQMKNFHLCLMLSQGIPMLFMGDEYCHTRQGNNNPWCQDNERNWFLWEKLEENKGFYNFYKFLIHFRKNNPLLHVENHWTEKEIKWHGINPDQPEWEKDNKFLAFTLHYPNGAIAFYAAFNASHVYQSPVIPNPGEGKRWQWIVNTKNSPPDDYFEESKQAVLTENTYRMNPYSSILLKTF